MLAEPPAVGLCGRASDPMLYRFIKRALDVDISAREIVVGFPSSAVLAAVIVARSKTVPFCAQRRAGLNGRCFDLIESTSFLS